MQDVMSRTTFFQKYGIKYNHFSNFKTIQNVCSVNIDQTIS